MRKYNEDMRTIGHKIIRLGSTPSTNDYLKLLAGQNAEDGLVVTANEQTAGRGQGGRAWVSPQGSGLYCSVLLKPDFPVEYIGLLSLFPAVAVADTVVNLTGLRVNLKWPNDVLINTRKIAGILAETKIRDFKIQWAVIGIGVNVTNRLHDLDRFNNGAGSLYTETGTDFSVQTVLDLLIFQLNLVIKYDKFESWRAQLILRWQQLCGHMNRSVSGPSVPSGIFRGLDDAGRALVETPDGLQVVTGRFKHVDE
ncbi:biotin--[acetyl-CoA-carboxylase] ligase [candidate division KSB1 bacterium]|nr:biotin--[acetyl-CoA-carboxylase] ligase [candidate division KSB1 bacterium]